MNFFTTALLIVLILVVGFSGYYYLDKVSPLKLQIEELRQRNEELSFELQELRRENISLSGQLEEKTKQISEEKNQEILRLKTTYESLVEDLREQVDKGEIAVTQLADRLKMKIVDRVLFASGQAEISPRGREILKRVSKILKSAKDKHIKVAGHTDNIPIHPKLKKQFPTNWELSVARATHVVRFLVDEGGIDPARLEAAGFAEFRPIATNKTRSGRLRNRRIEIVLMPRLK